MRPSRGPGVPISSLAKQLHIAYASDLDHSNLYRPSILLKLTNFNQDGGPGWSNNISRQQHNHRRQNQCLHQIDGTLLSHYVRVSFSSSFFLFCFFRLLQTCYCGRISTISSQAILKRKQAGMTYWINTQLSILPMQIERKVSHLPLDSEKPSERHGTCTHSPLLSSAFEGMTATSQRVKILKPILGSPAVFSFFFPSEQRKSGILQTSQNSLYFPCACACLCCYPPRAQYDPLTLCCYFQYKISIQGLLDASYCLFFTPPTWFSLNARQIEHFF